MDTHKFMAYSICNEINITEISKHFGIDGKIKWDQALHLSQNNLQGIVSEGDNKSIYLFHFGGVVFVNFQYHETQDALKYLIGINGMYFKNKFDYKTKEEFIVKIDQSSSVVINYNSVILPSNNSYYMETIALILAKSASLEKVENDINILFDEIEKIMEKLEKGKFRMKSKELTRMTSRILKVRFHSISYIEILDKPDIAWKHEGVEDLFLQFSELFELGDRFETMKSKTGIFLDIIEVFTTLIDSKENHKLEWIVILLIASEIIMSILDKVF